MSDAMKLDTFALQTLDWVYASSEPERIQAYLGRIDERFHEMPSTRFAVEYLGSRLALACRVWEILTADFGVSEEPLVKTFLRSALSRFEKPETAGLAAVFSDYYYAPESEEGSASLAIDLSRRLFQRLGLEANGQREGKTMLTTGFVHLVQVYEGGRSQIEERLLQFLPGLDRNA